MLNTKLSEKGNDKICAVAAICKDGKLLAGLRAYTPNNTVWTFPGGRCDKGETVKETLIREVEEETGINDLKIMDFFGKIPGAKEGDTVYIFYGVSKQEPILREPEKFIEWGWKFPEEISNSFINQTALKLVADKIKNSLKH